MSATNVEKLIKENKVQFVDFRFADMLGKQHHITFPAHAVDASVFEDGKMFDGSSITGWKGINDSDMVLMPDPASAVLDPFTSDPTLILTCDVLEPSTMQAYSRCPRSIARRAEAFLKSTGIADTAFFGPEPEFFIFDSVRWSNDMRGASFEIESEEAAWSSNRKFESGNSGHRPGVKGGYFPVAPVDSLGDLRGEMCKALEAMGLTVEVHHHEVATAGQCEIGTRFSTLVHKGDEMLTLKYVIKNVAHTNGKTATFMPKPIVGDNGSGMHVHQSLAKGGTNLFAGDLYGGLSQTALYYIGGIFKHARAINALVLAGLPTTSTRTSDAACSAMARPCSTNIFPLMPSRSFRSIPALRGTLPTSSAQLTPRNPSSRSAVAITFRSSGKAQSCNSITTPSRGLRAGGISIRCSASGCFRSGLDVTITRC